MPTLKSVAVNPILPLSKQMDCPPPLPWPPFGLVQWPPSTFWIGTMMYIWMHVAWLHTSAPGSPNQSHIVHAMSSIDYPHPHPWHTIKSLQQLHSHTLPPLGICIGASSSIGPTTYAHPLSPDLPNQGHGVAPWSKAWSCLRQSYANTPLLLQWWISTFPTYFESLTTHICPIKLCLPFWLCNAQYAWVKICITK